MKVDLRPFDETNLPRIVQLITKTNQFSLTTRRTTASEVMAWMQDPACYTQFMRLQDRFGDSGVTGVMVAVREGEALRIPPFYLETNNGTESTRRCYAGFCRGQGLV